ncbi:hypothetical protein FD725_21735 [Nostoc sp. TCL26-01]|nr:hypothetical protein FD725_21735 [Nostoc sp. TCL26-01]
MHSPPTSNFSIPYLFIREWGEGEIGGWGDGEMGGKNLYKYFLLVPLSPCIFLNFVSAALASPR